MSVISVLLPVYNAERYLRAALESVLLQTFSDFELLALDDGSTDRSLLILKEYASNDGRIRVISRPNRGIVATLNELIKISRGAYLARMDADDVCRPRRFEVQIEYLQGNPGCVAVGSKFLVIDPQGLPVCEFVDIFRHEEIDCFHIRGLGESQMCHPSLMMRRDAVVQVGLYREECSLAEDLDLLLRLAEIGKLANLPEVLLEYRHHPESICYTRPYQQRVAAQRAITMAISRRGILDYSSMAALSRKSETRAEVHRKWAWWALSAGHTRTAVKHAVKGIVLDPFKRENIRLLACAIRGY